MSIAFSVTLKDPFRLPEAGSLLEVTRAAATTWSNYIAGLGALEIELTIAAIPSGRASGGPVTSVFIGTDGVKNVLDQGSTNELATGRDPNGPTPDIQINVDPAFLKMLWLGTSGAVPQDRVDGMSVMLHELGHGLGIVGWRDLSTGALLQTYESPWDRLVQVHPDGTAWFTGNNARILFGGDIPVTTLHNGEQYFHLANSASEPLGQDLMNGVSFYLGERYTISDVDLAIAKDLGIKVSNMGKWNNPEFDVFYYAAHNPDVASAHLDLLPHFQAWGWREGRDPNAFFDTDAYLSTYTDIKLASINPLTHYGAYGWREGRDPSAAFDTSLYLKFNPDVAAAGLDPLAHYLQVGQAEGRKILPVVDTVHISNGFDGHYYKLANPDVAAAGIDPLAHYLASGAREGRNPDAFFDTSSYLAHNPDVAAAGVNPLLHYMTSGWREGRDPSSHFDTSAYLDHCSDVKLAGINPLEHFLVDGIAEGRSAYGDLI